MTKLENNIKKSFNEISIIDFDKRIIPIEHLGFSKTNYESLADFFLEFRSKFEDETILIKKKIYSLSKSKGFYDKKNFMQLYSSIKYDISILKSNISQIDSIYDEAFGYKNFVSKKIIEYRDYSKKMISFYENNLLTNYDGSNIIDFIEKIKNNNIQINNFFEPLEFEVIRNEFYDLNKNLNQFWNYINSVYIMEKEYKYILYSYEETVEFLKKNSKQISEININDANKILTIINSNLHSLSKKINDYNFVDAKKITSYIIFELLKIKKQLKLNFKSNEFYNEHKNNFLDLINYFTSWKQKVKKIYSRLLNNFTLDINFCNELNKSLNNFNNLFNDISKIDFNEELNSSDLLKTTQNFMTKIILWRNECKLILREAKTKYKYFKTIFNEITFNKIKLSLMLSFLKQNKINSDMNLKSIFRIQSNLSHIEQNILKNYNKNFEYHYNSLMDLKEEIEIINNELTKIFLMKKYIEKIVWYTNLQYFYKEKENVNIKNIIQFYKDGKYKEGISEAIKNLKNF